MKIAPDQIPRGVAFQNLYARVSDFLGFEERNNWMSLLVTGPWGSGKTSNLIAVIHDLIKREELKDEKIKKIKSYSVVSLSGLPKLPSDLEFYLSGVRRPEILVYATSGIANSIVEMFRGSSMARAALDAWKSHKNGLLIIDDLERKGLSLPIAEVLGLVTRFTETLDTKVILICNEDNLEGADATVLEKQREKVFDLKYRFAPTVAEGIGLHVADVPLRSLITTVLTGLGSNNFRIAQKIANGAAVLDETLRDATTPLVRAQIQQSYVKIAGLTFVTGLKVSQQELTNASGTNVSRIFRQTSEEPSALEAAVGAVDYTPSGADEIALEFINNGFVDKTQLETQLGITREEVEFNDARLAVEQSLNRFSCSFAADSSVLSEVRDALLRNASRLRWNTFGTGLYTLLRANPEDELVDLQMKWAEVGVLEHEYYEFSDIPDLPNRDAKAILVRRVEMAQGAARQESFLELLERGTFRFVTKPEFQNAVALKEQLLACSSPRLLSLLRKLHSTLKLWVTTPPEGLDQQAISLFQESFDEALNAIAQQDPPNASRVRYIRGL